MEKMDSEENLKDLERINEVIDKLVEERKGIFSPSPKDWRDQTIYFLLVDRFSNALENENQYHSPDPLKRKQDDKDDRDPANGLKWQGGTIKGITSKLDYIQKLGFNTIWVSPIFKNRVKSNTYHGYAIQNFLAVDNRFGTLEDLRELVRIAHEKNMFVILDIVINHTGDNWCYPKEFRNNKGETLFRSSGYDLYKWLNQNNEEMDETSPKKMNDAVWPKEFQNAEWYGRKGQIENWECPRESRHGDFFNLKKLKLTNDETLNAIISIYKYWIAATDIDGYRLDAIKHVKDSSTAKFCNAIREFAQSIGKNNFFLFGEIITKDIFINDFIGRNPLIPNTQERFPALDAALDHPLQEVLGRVIKGYIQPFELSKRYDMLIRSYSDYGQASQYFVTYVDNHDQRQRFLWNNDFKKQAVLAIGYLLTSRGIPCIYYGTEQGFDGGVSNNYDGESPDRFVRECMFGATWGAFGTANEHFFDTQHPIYRAISKIAKIRSEHPALRYGRQYFRETSTTGDNFEYPSKPGNTVAYSRIHNNMEILIAMNLNCEDKKNDWIIVDANLMPEKRYLEVLFSTEEIFNPSVGSGISLPVDVINSRHKVLVPLQPLEMKILRLKKL